MTLRQRPASGSAAVVPPAEAPSAANGSTNGAAVTFHWEAWFSSASPDQRAEALRLAEQQGLLYLQQLPAVTTRARPGAAPPLVPLLSRLLAGKVETLPPLADTPLTWRDTELDALQREAVRRALNTPDVCLLQGLPGTGKSRVVAEVIAQAAQRGWRVLLLAATAPAVDVVLGRLANCAEVLPIRLLAADDAQGVPAPVRAWTLAEQRRALRERTVAGARQARREAEELHRRRDQEENVWPQLGPIGERIVALQQRVLAHKQRLTQIGGEVEREAASLAMADSSFHSGPFVVELATLLRRSAEAVQQWEATAKLLHDKHEALRKDHERIGLELTALDARCQARTAGRWWTLGYWLGGSALRNRDALQVHATQVTAALKEAEQAVTAHEVARREIEEKNAAERKELLRGETQRRQQEVRLAMTALEQELAEAERSWQSLCTPIRPESLQPAGYRAADIEAARARWHAQRGRDAAAAQFSRQWADYLDTECDHLVERLPALANVIAGPIAALGQCPEVAGAPFDLLIIEEADQVTESELLRLATHAPRLLLVSEATCEPATPPPPFRKAPRTGRDTAHGLPHVAAYWPRLWQALGDDLGRLPYAWKREGNRLVCQLAIVRSEDAGNLEKEGLADAPEIELQILNLPQATPVLARVRFPAEYTIPQATAFIHRELQELPIQPLGRTAWWDATPAAFVLHLGPDAGAATETVELGDGVRLLLRGAAEPYAGCAARVEFARDAGWDRGRVEHWLQTHLHWRGRDRAVYLQVPYRQHRPLAEVVGPLLFADTCLVQLLASRAAGAGHFEFIPVPALRRPEWPREGAGLEQDLATGRHGDRLPAELRGELPRKGIVNYLEAQALVRRLEQWAQSPADFGLNGKATPAVLVIALYEAQAELLRRLVARSAILRARPLALEIAAPAQVRQRECDVLIVSLTRSHSHRCVPFGEDVADLVLTLTRARERLLIFGDPGTLVRRTQWQGALDHLDAVQAQLEGVRLARLVRHLQAAPSER